MTYSFKHLIIATAALCLLPQLALAETLQIEVNKGKRVSLPAAAASIVAANPDIADVQVVSPTVLYVYGKHVGETSVFAVDENDKTIYDATVEVSHNLSGLERTLKRVAPNADVQFSTVEGGLVMDGYTSTPAEAANVSSVASAFLGEKERMVNMLTTNGSDQVTLKVKIAEMSRTDIKKLGINLQSVFTPGGIALQILQGNPIALAGGILDRDNTNTAIYSSYSHGNTTINSVIEALETQGLVSTLAEPSLTTTSGKAASFLAGGEFPIPVKDGNGSITVQYKSFGVSLNFTPVVMSKDRMSITVAPEVSTINFDNPIEVAGIKNPIVLTRRAQSTVELGSGDTFVLAGLLKNERNNNVEKFPGLGDLPVLGTLFRSNSFQNDQSELVILVTPYIVRAQADPAKLQTPEQGYVPPTDMQRLLIGNLYQQESMDNETPASPGAQGLPDPIVKTNSSMPKLHGEGGFILE